MREIRRVLIANRGEIALRVVRACRELGIQAIAVYSESESNAQHVRAADDAYLLPSGSGIPYLNIEALLKIASRAAVDAVHPGYGFLAENAKFASAVRDAGFIFIGPSADAIDQMGDKVRARNVAIAAEVAPVPGTTEPVNNAEAAAIWANQHGYPVAVKASGGGGGRGFRVAHTAGDLPDAFAGSVGEAERYFANPDVYLERYLERPRHIEIQVFADQHGNVVAFPERDCSVQRRHQKLIEESPSPAVSEDVRQRLQEAAVRLTRAVAYEGAGTLEFLLDSDRSFYFLEMNTRIQVEHTVTEMVTGIDLVKEQIQVARGEPLSFAVEDVRARGWAIETRINAEDAGRNFAPTPGAITSYHEPGGFGVRVDAALVAGDAISPEFDSMIAKLVTWGRDRSEAIARMHRALNEFDIAGVATTLPFHRNVLASDVFATGDVTTTFIDEHPELLPEPQEATTPNSSPADTRQSFTVEVGGRRFDVSVLGLNTSTRTENHAVRNGPRKRAVREQNQANGDALISPVQGTVIRVAVEAGQTVEAGQVIAVVEAMKMENELTAHKEGTISELSVSQGATVRIGATIAVITD